MYKIGVIGLGYRIHYGVLNSLYEWCNEVKVSAICDPATDKVKEKIAEKPDYFVENPALYTDVDEMLQKEEFDGIIIGTRCSLHTEMAIKAMEKKVPIFLEKPVCTSMEEFNKLYEATKKYNPQVVVSFPLRYTALTTMAKEIIDSGKIGDILQVDAFNDVPYGRVYFKNWYRNEEETGGLWLQKATHDFDYLNYILGNRITEVFARNVKKLFKGDMPENLKCVDCPKYKTCPESTYVIEHTMNDKPEGQYCSFAEDTGNEDCGTALLRCASGAIVSYAQNFYARHKAARRGARFLGYKGTLEFDWYKSEVKVYMHTSPLVETYSFEDNGSHFGGDNKLAELFVSMLEGKKVKSYMYEGLESAYLCLLAKESCETGANIVTEDLF